MGNFLRGTDPIKYMRDLALIAVGIVLLPVALFSLFKED